MSITINKKTAVFVNNFFQKASNKNLGKALYSEDIPKTFLPHIFFAGKSNVGKSSLINEILMRKHLIRTSKTPGCTIHLNFFQIAQKFILVDSPGYGYAKSVELSLKWKDLLHSYFANQKNVLVFLLIDSRRGISEKDLDLIQFLDQFWIKIQIIFTKCDKKDAEKSLEQKFYDILSTFQNINLQSIFTSSAKKIGIENIRNLILNHQLHRN